MIEKATLIVLIIRIIGPLIILKKPLLGALISEYVLDVSDAFIWNYFGGLPVNYSIIDKRLDMYALVLMAITLRKWKLNIPRNIALGLFGYRLIGYILFEITLNQIYFFFFANLFIFFFIFYLIAEKFEKQNYFTKPKPLIIIFSIILLLKMPQEYLLHYGKIIDWNFIKNLLNV
jgi:hypothetical protein